MRFPKLSGLRALLYGTLRGRAMVASVRAPNVTIKRFSHDEGPPKPFDNMPFPVPNRYVTTVVFILFFGVGLWAPFLILWYSMAKRTL